MGPSGRIPAAATAALIGVVSTLVVAERYTATERSAQLRVIEFNEPDGQILSYRHLAGSTEVHMRGTALAPEAKLHLKIGSRPGFVELDINRGQITGLAPASHLGKDFLTYVLWAVSVDGHAANLGEITFNGNNPVSINVTTPYQTFWLMITAEPSYAVVDPSSLVAMYSVRQDDVTDNRALPIRGQLFYFTHYANYESSPAIAPADVPNQLLQARKAVELASKSGVLAADRSGSAGLKEEEYTREALSQATTFLGRAEDAYRRNPKDQEVVQFARTAAQSAENARALALGAVGGLLVHQLENEVANLRDELERLKASKPVDGTLNGPAAHATSPGPAAPPATLAAPLPLAVAAPPLVKQPALWFAVVGWGLAVVLLFRRRSL
jgi:uncharacterized small protein (DUF1192 family)